MEFDRNLLRAALIPTPFKVALKDLGTELANFLAKHNEKLQEVTLNSRQIKVGYVPIGNGDYFAITSFPLAEVSRTCGASRIAASIDNRLLEIHFFNPEHDLGVISVESSILCTFSAFGHTFSKVQDGTIANGPRDEQLTKLFNQLTRALRSDLNVEGFSEPLELVTVGEQLGGASFSALARTYREQEVLEITDSVLTSTLSGINEGLAKVLKE